MRHNHPESLKAVAMYIETMFLIKKNMSIKKLKLIF